jgi:Fic family protein
MGCGSADGMHLMGCKRAYSQIPPCRTYSGNRHILPNVPMGHQLQDPRNIYLSTAVQQLLGEVSTAVDNLNKIRPLSPEIAARLREALLPDRVVASLNMEGIIATRRQTLAVMDAMRVHESIGGGEREVFNALKADEFVHDSVENGEPLSEAMIREINALLLQGLRPDAGTFRVGDVTVLGAKYTPPLGVAVPPLVRQLIDIWPHSESVHAIVQAAWLHNQFTYIHPFNDGNGRGGRLLQDWSLIRRGYWPVGIPTAKRDDYYAALEDADNDDWNDLVELVGLLQLDITSKVAAVVDEAATRASWVDRLAKAAAAKRENTRHKQYLVWRKRVEDVAAAFRQAARELDGSSDVIGATFRDYSVVDFRDWENICLRGQSDRTWIFSLLMYAEGRPFWKTIAYVKRHAPIPTSDTFAPLRDAVAIYFTGMSVPDVERADFAHFTDPHIRLREILPTDDGLLIYTEDEDDSHWQVTNLHTPSKAVEQFFLDVFERKAGLGS